MTKKIDKTKEEWKKELDSDVYNICFEGGTEMPFSGEYNDYKGDGVFLCNCCKEPLFDAKTKFDSGTGWPSFYEAIDTENVDEERDLSHGMIRTEVKCSSCGAHLGHVFEDGPEPTGKRYCINSKSLKLKD